MKKIFFYLFLSSLTLNAETTTTVHVSITIGDQKTMQSNHQKNEDTYSYSDPVKKSLQLLAYSAAGMTAYNFYKTCQKQYDVIKKYLLYIGIIASCGYMITKYPKIFKPSAGAPSLPPSPPSLPFAQPQLQASTLLLPTNAPAIPAQTPSSNPLISTPQIMSALMALALMLYNKPIPCEIPIEA